jgi:hypothetical protein
MRKYKKRYSRKIKKSRRRFSKKKFIKSKRRFSKKVKRVIRNE